MKRRDVVKKLLSGRKDLLVIAGLGSTAWDITAAGDADTSFPMWGAMGQAAMMGLGLATAVVAKWEGALGPAQADDDEAMPVHEAPAS